MIIDAHVHPVLFGPICEDIERVNFRKKNFGLYKSSPVAMEQVMLVMNHAKVDQAILLAEDYSAEMGEPIVSNEEVKQIIDLEPERFIGFASVDPRLKDAPKALEKAFKTLGLSGLKLNLSHLMMWPDDPRLQPLYELCVKYDKPITFHAGFSWEPNSPSKYGQPIRYEDVAVGYPTLRFCLAHLAWPWVDEAMMLLLKYPNVYTDTATVFMDSPKNYYEQVFMKNMAPGWLQNNLMDKVMWGSNLPRFRQVRTKAGIEALPIRDDVKEKILGRNARVFLGMEARYEY